MPVVESKLHLLQVVHKVAPSDADMARQFGLDKAPEILYPVNVAAVTVGVHPRVRNQAVAIDAWPTVARLAGTSNTNKRIKVRSCRVDKRVLGSNAKIMYQDTKGLQI